MHCGCKAGMKGKLVSAGFEEMWIRRGRNISRHRIPDSRIQGIAESEWYRVFEAVK